MNKLIQYIFIYVNIDINAAYQTEEKTETAVREAGVSRDHGAQLGLPLKPLGPSQHYCVEDI